MSYLPLAVRGQVPVSLSTDVGAVRNFKKDQGSMGIAHVIQAQFHVAPKHTVFGWLAYTTPMRSRENLTAIAKSPVTVPEQLSFRNRARMTFTEISFGWKYYLAGHFAKEDGINIYSLAGLGLLMGRVVNTQSVFVDTTLYGSPVLTGRGNFKRLTLDVGLGGEWPVGGDFYLYTEGKLMIPLTDYPSPYLRISKYAPLPGFLSFGVRALFN